MTRPRTPTPPPTSTSAPPTSSPRPTPSSPPSTPTVAPTPTPGGSTNLAFGKTATQSSTGFGGVASRAVDGTTDGSYFNGSTSHTNSDAQAWWQVDLGAVQSIGNIALWNRTDCCGDRLSNFYVLVSDVPFTSTSLSPTLAQSGVSAFFTSGQRGTTTTIGVNRTGRYVRVQLSGTNYLALAEVQVWSAAGPPAPTATPTLSPTRTFTPSATVAAPVNLALGKTASQSSTGWGGVASRPVDGNTNGLFSNNSVSHTLGDAQAWWHVDLGSVQNIGNVHVWNRTDCCGARLSAFYVLVSDVPFGSTALSATLAQSGVSAYLTAGQAGTPTTIAVNRTGRYVRVQLSGTDYLSLAEVQVWSK